MQDDPREPQHPAEQPISIQDEMRTSYLDYAMSVIIGRAIPDVRDGLKPVHRRILYAMRDLNLSPGGSYSKCAKVVGQVLGNYHPHGDASVYDALVRMAQDFSMRHMLVDGQGNFGSVDGDPAAAYRYTECRLARISSELLADIEKETVDFSPNFDESSQEPDVLPARFPNLLVNGSGGIAVGMATNIPPHNLVEVIDATVHLIGNPGCNVADLMKFVQGPDFPTAAMIYGRAGIAQAYLTGRGSIIMRARHDVEKVTGSADREQIVFTEIPFQVNKARLHAKIGELMRDKRIEGIREARDESDRDGMRLVLELKKDVFPTVVLNQLYRMTDLQSSFGIINLSIVDGRPAVLDLKETLRLFVEHRRDVVSRRTRFDLAKAEGQRDIVEGLGMAITEVDLVIKTIRESSDPEIAQKKLMELPLRGLEAFVKRAGRPEAEIEAAKARGDYRLSERQAKAILDMRLARLTGLEQEKLAAEYGELSEEITRLRTILADESVLMALIVKELEEVKEKHGQKRRTEIVDNEAEIQVEDLIQEEEMVVTISHAGYIKRTPVSTYRAQKRGGKGTQGMEQRDDDDFVTQLFIGSTHSFVFFFSTSGKLFVKKVYEIPQAARNAKGRAIVNFLELPPEEKVATIAQVKAIEAGWYVTTITRGGQIKKTELIEYENYRDKGIIGVKIVEGDSLLSAIVTDGKAEFLIATKTGQSIRFDETQVRPMGRGTAGVKAIDLSEGDEVVGLARTEPERQFVLAVCERGYGKRTVLDEFRQQNRGGKGIILIETSERNGPVVGIAMVKPEDEVMLITDRGQTIRTPVEGIRETGRNTQGVKLMRIGEDERVVAIEPIGEGAAQGLDEEENGEGSGEGEAKATPSEAPPAEGDGEASQGDGEASQGDGEAAPKTAKAATATAKKTPKLKLAGVPEAAALYRLIRARHADAHCELDHKSPFELLVATVLSAQSTDVMVNKITPELFRRWPGPAELAAAEPSEVEQVLSKIGMFRQKTKNIVGLSKLLVQNHQGQVPRTLDELVKLPGVGRKTANVVLGVAFGAPEGVVVDTHVQRISQRLGLTRHTDPVDIEQDLMRLYERPFWDPLSHTLIFHGRRICTARKPACAACPAQELCPSAFNAESVGRKPQRVR